MALILYHPVFWAALLLIGLLFLWVARRLRLRWWPAWVLRVFMVALILVGIFHPETELAQSAIPQREIMIVDLTDSVSEETRQNFLETARIWQMQSTSRILLVYGEQVAVIYPGETSWPEVDGRLNNLNDALKLAGSMLGDMPGKIILATDGLLPASDELDEMVQTFSTIGSVIDWIPLSSRDFTGDAYVEQLWAPRNLWQGLPFRIILPIYALSPLDEINYHITVNEAEIEIIPEVTGEHYVEFLVPPQAQGIVTIEAFADVPSDPNLENNTAYLSVQVHKEPQALFISADTSSPGVLNLLAAMSAKGIVIDQISTRELPTSIEEISPYQIIFLNNTLASELTREQMLMLRLFVTQLGGGLILLGGYSSYTLGGYQDSLLEPMLPVKLEPPDRAQRPSIVFVLVLDRSGSMGDADPGAALPINLAREAAMRSLETLQAEDYLGVLAFNAKSTWVVPLQQLGEGLELRNAMDAISSISANDGTKLLNALEEALLQVSNLPSFAPLAINLLVLSDGESEDGDLASFTSLAERAHGEGVNISTIAFGMEADEQIMQAIARNGNGRYYRVMQAEDLPRMMIQESQAIRGGNKQEGETSLVMSSDNPDHPILTGLSQANLPLLYNYIALKSRSDEGAEDILVSANFGDPILSAWQYGLGRVVTWTTDVGGEWTGDWPSSNALGAFWSQVTRYAIPQPGLEPAMVEINASGTTLEIGATIMDENTPDAERYLNLAEVKFSYVEQNGEIRTYILPQTAPGHYQLDLSMPTTGAYRAVLEYTTPQGKIRLTPILFEVNTPQEWLPIHQADTDIVDMEGLISKTGGHLISINSLSLPSVDNNTEVDQSTTITTPRWWYLMLALITLWPLEIAIRRRWLPWM